MADRPRCLRRRPFAARASPRPAQVFDLVEAALEPLASRSTAGCLARRLMGRPRHGRDSRAPARRISGSPAISTSCLPGDGWLPSVRRARSSTASLIGRGANDMKSAIAASSPPSRGLSTRRHPSLILTGDEEGYATYGTPRIIDWLNGAPSARHILIGEPTCRQFGDTVKMGRRGSVKCGSTCRAFRLTSLIRIAPPIRSPACPGDYRAGFGPSRRWTDVSTVDPGIHRVSTPTDASNVSVRRPHTDIRFNNSTGRRPGAHRRRLRAGGARRVPRAISGRGLFDPSWRTLRLLSGDPRRDRHTPELSTSGGTSDGRFLIQLFPVVDGPPNATMHKLDESAAVADIQQLSRIYERIVRKVFA